jgi:UDP-N-acetylmuramate--alanine ligase
LLEGRRLWFVGIGGAGLSSYAFLARAWGAEVGGWDRVETPYLRALDGVDVRIASEPVVPDGWEVVVSSAYPAVPGKSRAELLAELVSLRRSIVVAGAHGKTTTTGMIAFVLSELGLDPAWLVGGEIAQLGGNAGAGEGWLVVEGDESDRTVERLRPEIGVVTNVELDHHSTFASAAEVEAMFDRWLAGVPQVVRGWEVEPASFGLAVPGEHNRRNAATALACSRASEARAGASSWSARRAVSRSSTTTPITRPRSRRPSRPRASAAPAVCSFSSSHTSTRARVISRTSSAPRCRPPTPPA